MFRFAEPSALQLLWLVPAIVAMFVYTERRARRRMARALGDRVFAVLTASVSPQRKRLKLALQCLALVFFIVALARPQHGKSERQVKSEGIEIMVAFDVSTSMLAEDVRPSRLQQAKSEVERFLDLLSGDKVGLVAFAGSAVLVSPLTTDKAALKMFIESLSPISVETQGTDIAKALREARSAFERGGADPGEGARMTRVVLLISDGESHEPGALEEARLMAGEGIRIFSMSIGTERGAPIPLRDERGYIQGYKRDKSGKEVVTKTNSAAIKEVATAGKGSFYRASFGGAEARMLKQDLDKLEKAEFDTDVAIDYNERYQIFLLIGMFFAFADMALSERRKVKGIWKGRFMAAALSKTLVPAGLLLGGPPEMAEAWELRGVQRNNESVKLYEAKRMSEAYGGFAQSLGDLPFQSEVHYNLGRTYFENKEYEKALKEGVAAARLADGRPEQRFKALFLAAAAAGAMKKIDEALSLYQSALELAPTSKEVKTNIELLLATGGGNGKGDSQGNDEGEPKEGGSPDKPKDGEGEQNDQKQGQPKRIDNKSRTPRPFQSEQLSNKDVENILDEINEQEERIRAKFQREGAKDAPKDEDW